MPLAELDELLTAGQIDGLTNTFATRVMEQSGGAPIEYLALYPGTRSEVKIEFDEIARRRF